MGVRFRSFVVSYKESDLWIGIDPASWDDSIEKFAADTVVKIRKNLEEYGKRRPEFFKSLDPIAADTSAPPVAATMMEAARAAGVGPMAAVAGAVARAAGEKLTDKFGPHELIIENGGDIWLRFELPVDIAVFAGNSPLSGKIGITLPPSLSPCGVCTSSGTIGPSLSFGYADAAMIVCQDAALADAWATAAGNMVLSSDDISSTIKTVGGVASILSVILVVGDRMGIGGRLPLKIFRNGPGSK
jgi:ApbE superfamily uncharacterized protein (UPF0280 family)